MTSWHDKVQRIKDEHYNEEYNEVMWNLENLYPHCDHCGEDVYKLNRVWTDYPHKYEMMCEECEKEYQQDRL